MLLPARRKDSQAHSLLQTLCEEMRQATEKQEATKLDKPLNFQGSSGVAEEDGGKMANDAQLLAITFDTNGWRLQDE